MAHMGDLFGFWGSGGWRQVMVLIGGKRKMEMGGEAGRDMVLWVKNGNGNGKWDGSLNTFPGNQQETRKEERSHHNRDLYSSSRMTSLWHKVIQNLSAPRLGTLSILRPA
jgi:hypothetical protein